MDTATAGVAAHVAFHGTRQDRIAQAVIERLVADGHRFLTVAWNSDVASFMQQHGVSQDELVRCLRETSPMRPTGTADSDFVARCGEIAIAVARYELRHMKPREFFGGEEGLRLACESMAGRAQVVVDDFEYAFRDLANASIEI